MYHSKCYVKTTRSHNLQCVFIPRCQRHVQNSELIVYVHPSGLVFFCFFHYKKPQWLNKKLRRINLLKVTETQKALFFLGYNPLNFILFWWQRCTQIKWNIYQIIKRGNRGILFPKSALLWLHNVFHCCSCCPSNSGTKSMCLDIFIISNILRIQ